MQRVPIRLFRLKQQTTDMAAVLPTLSDSAFARGVTTDSIIQGPTHEIRLSAANIQGLDIPAGQIDIVKQVSQDSDGHYYVNAPVSGGSKKVYIRDPQKSTEDDIPSVFEFYVNPQNIQTNYRKIQTEVRTRGGWEVQHWGDQLTEVRVSGKSGGLHRDISKNVNPGAVGQTLSRTQNVTESTAWKRLTQLKRLYDNDHARKTGDTDRILLGMNYFDRFFIGYFVEFQGPNATAENPFIVDYSFTFKVQRETSYDQNEIKQTLGSIS